MPADFDPDKRYQYSNTNYLLIGEILDSTWAIPITSISNGKSYRPLDLYDTYSRAE